MQITYRSKPTWPSLSHWQPHLVVCPGRRPANAAHPCVSGLVRPEAVLGLKLSGSIARSSNPVVLPTMRWPPETHVPDPLAEQPQVAELSTHSESSTTLTILNEPRCGVSAEPHSRDSRPPSPRSARAVRTPLPRRSASPTHFLTASGSDRGRETQPRYSSPSGMHSSSSDAREYNRSAVEGRHSDHTSSHRRDQPGEDRYSPDRYPSWSSERDSLAAGAHPSDRRPSREWGTASPQRSRK